MRETSAPSDDELWQWALDQCTLLVRRWWAMAAMFFAIAMLSFFVESGSFGVGSSRGMSAIFAAVALAMQHSTAYWTIFGRDPKETYWARVRTLAPMMSWIFMGAFALWALTLTFRTSQAPDDWPDGVIVLLFAGVGSRSDLRRRCFVRDAPTWRS